MPPKGYKKPSTGRSRPNLNLTLSKQCQDLLSAIAIDQELINPRNGEPNKSKAVETAALAYKLFRRTYPDRLPYPQALLHTLYQIQQSNGDTSHLLEQIQEHIEYIESWGAEVAMNEMIAEGVIKTKDGSYIA